MRDYNFRSSMKEKEQNRRKEVIKNHSYWPSMPKRAYSENGEPYYTEGTTGYYKKFLKQKANKAVRKTPISFHIPNGASYKKVYELAYEWY